MTVQLQQTGELGLKLLGGHKFGNVELGATFENDMDALLNKVKEQMTNEDSIMDTEV